MTIQIGSYAFEGPLRDSALLGALSGVYVVLGVNPGDASWRVLDVGESVNVRDRISNHDRNPCWAIQGKREIAYAAHYANEASRMQIERELRLGFNPPCGER